MANSSIYSNCYKEVLENGLFFNIFIGGRGIGKTYSVLSETLKNNDTILYVRRTDTELKNCCDALNNPYKIINTNLDRHVTMEANKDSAVIWEDVDGEKVLRGYGAALSTFSKFRGADYSDVGWIVFDEFILIRGTNTIKDEAGSLFDLIETVNRNRELEGKEAVKVVLLSNANTIDNGIIRALGLGDIISQMKINNEHEYIDKERGIRLMLLENTKVKDMKMKTKLYQLTKGTNFYDMALDNEFTRDYFGDLTKPKYTELTPVVTYNKVTFYKHKSKDIMFASYRRADCDRYNERTLQSFKRNYGYLLEYYIEGGLMLYADYNVKMDVMHIF